MYPWPKKDKALLPKLLELHRGYFEATRPLVVVAYGETICGIVRTGFRKEQKTPRSETFVDRVGVPHLCEVDSTYFVLVPSFHPGSISRFDNDTQARFALVFNMTLCIAWLAVDIVLRNTTPEASTQQADNRRSLCESIIDDISVATGPGTDLR